MPRQVFRTLRALGSRASIVVVFNGAYATRESICPLPSESAADVTRLRRDAKLFRLPVDTIGQRGRQRKYGKHRIVLPKRAGHSSRWVPIHDACYGVMVAGVASYFLANIRRPGRTVRVVLLEHGSGNWAV